MYMVDLESGLHYLLRVELATHKTLEGVELKTFKDFVTVVAKVGPINKQVFCALCAHDSLHPVSLISAVSWTPISG